MHGLFTVSGARTGKALTILNETGDQNILTASSSGTTRFTIANDGDLEVNGTTVLHRDSSITGSIFYGDGGQSAGATDTYTTAVGIGALNSLNNSGGSTSTGVGFEALFSMTSGDDNTGIGHLALRSTTTGDDNTAVGHNALNANTTADENTAIGSSALLNNDIGYENTAIGRSAMRQNTDGYRNTAVGRSSMFSSTTGFLNAAQGYSALQNITTGDSNAGLGAYALFSNTTGRNNTAVGYQAGYDYNNTGGEAGNNTFIGYNTGRGITTGTANTILGANVTGLSSTLSNNIIIADGSGNQRINVNSSGNVGIGNASPVGLLDVDGAVTGKALVIFNETGNQDILTASASGTTVFRVANDGDLVLANAEFIDNNTDGTIVFDTDETDGAGVIRLPVKTTTGDPALNVEGNTYYNTADNVFRCYTSSGWVNCDTTGGVENFWELTSNTLSPGGGSSDNNDKLVIGGPESSVHQFEVNGTQTGKALVVFNDTGTDQNILSASASGTTVLNLDRSGNLSLLSQGDIRLFDSDNSDYTGFQSPSALTETIVYSLPTADATAANQVLASDASGALSWIDVSGGAGSLWTQDTGTLYPTTLNNEVGIGTTTAANIISKLFVTNDGSATGKSLAIFDQTESQDIFSASASGTTRLTLNNDGDLLPGADDTQDLGSNTLRWQDLYLGPGSINIGTSGNNYTMQFDTAGVGTLVFNEAGDDTDFRIEGNTIANLFFVDASTDRIGIGTTSPGAGLDIQRASLALAAQNTTDAASNQVATFGGGNRATPTDGDEAYFSFVLDNDAGTQTEFGRLTWVVTDVTDTTKDSFFKFEAFKGNDFQEFVRFGSVTAGGQASVIFNENSNDHNFKVETNSFDSMFTIDGASNTVQIGENQAGSIADFRGSGIVFNENSNDKDFRVEGNNDQNLLFVDGGNDKIGISNASPVGLLDVDGAVIGKALVILNETGDQAILTASASGTTRFIIENGGNVGIGIADPTELLHLTKSGDDARTRLLLEVTGGTNQDTLITFSDTGESVHWSIGADDSGDVFRISNSTELATTTRLLIDSSGNIGIGDDTPDAKLEVLRTGEQLRLTYTDDTVDARFSVDTTGDLTIDLLGGGTVEHLILANADVLNIGGSSNTDVAYNIISDSSTASGANIDSDNDLYIEGSLEVDGTLYADGGIDTAFTLGSVIFAGASGVLTEDNTNFFWDDTDNKLGIGLTPVGKLDVNGAVIGKALVIFDETGNQNILTASASGTTVANLTRGGALELADGTAGAPSFTFINDNDTGIYSVGADTLGFSVAGTGELGLTATNLYPITAEGLSLGSATNEFEELFLGDDAGIQFGLDQDWSLVFDQATDTRLELTTAGTSGMLISSATVSGTGLALEFDSVTSGIGASLSLDALTSGTGFLLESAPGSATTLSGNLFRINVGGNVTVTGDIFRVDDNGTELFSIDQNIITNALPTEFTSAGDVSISYDLIFTNQTSSYIKSNAPLYIQVGESFESNDLTLQTYNSGDIIIDNVDNGTIATFKGATGNVGFGDTSPEGLLDVDGAVIGQALLQLNESGNQNIFTASAVGRE